MPRSHPRARARFHQPRDWAPTPLPNWHGLLMPAIEANFERLGVGVSLWESDDRWHPIRQARNVTSFEYEHGVAERRHRYNHRCLRQAASTKKAVRGTFGGFTDLFVPVFDATALRGILVAGPIATEAPSSTEVLHRWHELTRTHARPSDASFLSYVSVTLGTLQLAPQELDALEALLDCFANSMLGLGKAEALRQRATALQQKLSRARFAEEMWKAARDLLEAPSTAAWATHAYGELARFGLDEAPNLVMVGLVTGRSSHADPIGDVIRRNAFQRACVEVARKQTGALCARVGDYGIAFLVSQRGSPARVQAKFSDLIAAASSAARGLGLGFHAGTSPANVRPGGALSEPYRIALSAAEQALSDGVRVVQGTSRTAPALGQFTELRAALTRALAERPAELRQRFDRYMDTVLERTGYRVEIAQAHFESGLERLAEPLLAAGLLEPKDLAELSKALTATADARTVADLVAAYRSVVLEMEAAISRPTPARQNRGVGRAIAFIREHLSEPLELAKVARVAGFAPSYFCALFARTQGVPFRRYVSGLRIERARHMLLTTNLSVEQVQKLSGFQTREHFHVAFKKAVGVSPVRYREGEVPAKPIGASTAKARAARK
jgi:AraC-like DNA-binding protein